MADGNRNKKWYESRITSNRVPAEPPKDVLLPDIYADNNWTPKLAIDDRAPTDVEAEGFNPYDTAVLHRK